MVLSKNTYRSSLADIEHLLGMISIARKYDQGIWWDSCKIRVCLYPKWI